MTNSTWKVLLLVCALQAGPILAQEGEDPFDKADTFSEMLQAEERARKQQADAMAKSVEDRDNRFGVLPEDAPEELKQSYQQRIDSFRETIQAMREIFTKYQLSDSGIATDLQFVREWDKNFDLSQTRMTDWLNEMARIYSSDPAKYNNLGLTLMEVARREGQLDRVEHVYEAAKAVFAAPPADIDPPLLEAIGYIGYANNDYELAQKAWDQYTSTSTLPAIKMSMYRNIENAKNLWQVELEQRKQDESKNNPIVELVTSKGVLTVELFEDEAPESVANFIYLAKNKFYTRMRVFRVIPNFGVQVGCKVGDGTGNAGYSIKSETDEPGARGIFRGSLFYALSVKEETKQIDVNSTSSQFLISAAALPNIDDSVTVFGRVIQGLPKIGVFYKVDLSEEEQRKDPSSKTDFLIETNIIKSRDHEYKPTATGGKLPF